MSDCFAACSRCPAGGVAHHGWSEYDSSKTLKLTGKIVESGYEHPHGIVALGDAGARPGTWCWRRPRAWSTAACEGAAQAGATATVEGYANRDKPEEMRAERIIDRTARPSS
jgi:hypothetical protein